MLKVRISPLDRLFSEFVRKRAIKLVGGCERCLTWKRDYKELQCSHFFGRAQKSVRWDEDNACGLCFGCHQYFGSHPLEYVEWFKQRLGVVKFDLLQVRAWISYPKPDKEAIRLYFKEQIRRLED